MKIGKRIYKNIHLFFAIAIVLNLLISTTQLSITLFNGDDDGWHSEVTTELNRL